MWELALDFTQALARVLSVICPFVAAWQKGHDRDTAALWMLGWAILFQLMTI